MNKIKLGRYQHYKGKFYKVIGIAHNSETLQKLVVYQGQYDCPEFGKNPIFVRPLEMFLEQVTVDGKEVPRFKYIK